MPNQDTKPSHINIRGIDLLFYERVHTFKRETEVLDFIDSIPPKSTLFDIGACGGAFSLYAAKKNIKVWSFEPDLLNYKLLIENIDRNPKCKENILPIQKAIGAKNRLEDFCTNSDGRIGGHRKILDSASREDLNIKKNIKKTVSVLSLDTFCYMNIVPDYMKIDVDGSEMNLTNGSLKMFKEPKLKGIVFELNVADLQFNSINSLLNSCGLKEKSRHHIEKNLYNIIYGRNNEK